MLYIIIVGVNVINELYLFSNISFKRIERVVKHGLLPGRSTFWDILRNRWHEVLNTNDCDIFIQYYLFSLRLQAYCEVGALELFDLSNSVCHWLTLLLRLETQLVGIGLGSRLCFQLLSKMLFKLFLCLCIPGVTTRWLGNILLKVVLTWKVLMC